MRWGRSTFSAALPPQSVVPSGKSLKRTTDKEAPKLKSLSKRNGFRSARVRHYFLAVVLPIITSVVASRFDTFSRTPYALSLLAIAFIASLGGIAPSILAVAVAVVARFALLFVAGQPVPPWSSESIRIASILTAALIFSVSTRSRRIAQSGLEVAHYELRDRTDALVESLHSSKCASWTMEAGTNRGPVWFSGSYRIFGRPFSEIDRLDFFLECLYPEDRERVAELLIQMKTTKDPILFEYRATWPDGGLHWFEMRANHVPGTNALWRGLTMDITERKLTESALLRSEKLAAMGRLASTVAHEINNPLEAVTNLLFLAQSDKNLHPETQGYLLTAEKELARLGEITRLTLGFVRNTSLPQSVEIASIADEVLSIFRHRLDSKGVQIERAYQPDVTIQIAPHELRQILTNLISNASDAIEGPDSKIAIRIQQNGENIAQVIVEDNGSGIAPPALLHVFEPFFTTKMDIGTGIGLWVTHELVQSNGGRITAESGTLAEGVKTRFTIDFPASAVS